MKGTMFNKTLTRIDYEQGEVHLMISKLNRKVEALSIQQQG